ncbi:MAG: DNA packaging protein [Betaproteobacteria bacterium]|nr:DNA packaging protein [Betaproteobacteria bacterium]
MPMAADEVARAQFKALLADRNWRLSHLYYIRDKRGQTIRFTPNPQQAAFLADMHVRNIDLKSRQHGFTTLGSLLALDTALFRSGTHCGIVMHQQKELEKVFRGKVMFAYERLPDWLKQAVPIKRLDMSGEVEFVNGSQIAVGLSHRGGTLQWLWISEFGPMCAFTPQRAEEVVSGALNTLTPECIVTIESTAHGRGGEFHAMCTRARSLANLVGAGAAKLTNLDYKFHFYPWFGDVANQLDPDGVPITTELADYFTKLDVEHGITLSPSQKAWYAKKSEEQGDKMRREHPSTADEAFEAAIEGAYYGKELTKAEKEGRISDLPIIPGVPVNTFWDIGMNDTTAIWFHQKIGPWHHFIDFYENSGEQAAHYARKLVDRGYQYGKHYVPHDGVNTDWSANGNKTRAQILQDLLPGDVVLVERIDVLGDGIDMVRQALARCRFDRTRCGEMKPGSGRGGLPSLQGYQKKWNETTSTWHDYPLHNWASNGADAFRQWAQAYPMDGINDKSTRSRRRARDRDWKTT